MEQLIISLISASVSSIAAIVVCLLNNHAQLRKRDIEQDKHITEIKEELNKQISDVKTELREQMMELNAAYQQSVAVITVKLDDLDKKQEKHNKVIERTYNLESYTKLLDERVKHLERSAK